MGHLSCKLLLAWIGLASSITAQQTSDLCPKIQIEGPQEPVRNGVPIDFRAVVAPVPSEHLIFYWRFSSGKIVGNSTGRHVKLEDDAVRDCESLPLQVQVQVEGLPDSCETSATAEFLLTTGNCDIFPVDQYRAKLFTKEEKPVSTISQYN